MGKDNNYKINKSIFILLILILGVVALVIYFSSKTDNSSVQSSNLESLEKSSVYKNDKFKFTLNLPSNLDSVLQTEDDKFARYLLYDKKFSADLKNKSDLNPLLELTEKMQILFTLTSIKMILFQSLNLILKNHSPLWMMTRL
jgi:hypothetical protein